jgi:uncharacterized tellurite resistance protein B-like protein
MSNKIPIENAQFTLYYLLMAVDGNISDAEKNMFLNIVSGVGGFRRSYAESIFNGMHKFKHLLNYKSAIDTLSKAPLEDRQKTVRVMREIGFADGAYEKEEGKFLVKVQQDLGLIT